MNRQDKDVPAALSRETFESIVYNAVGRASEINTYPAYALSHSTGNSGWSVGIVQWDFGQPGRGHKVEHLLQGYQSWAQPEDRFRDSEIASLTHRLQRRGQTGNALDSLEQARLNGYLRSNTGRVFVDSLNQEQLDYKWREVGEPLAGIQWLKDLQDTHPAQAVEIMTMANKLFNQNEIRGRRLRDHLQQNESTSDGVRDWIGSDGINGLNPAARKAILSGRNQALAGSRLLNALGAGSSPLSERWRETLQRGDHSLSSGFQFNPDLQLFDTMLRHPQNGLRLLRQVEGESAPAALSIRGINALARREMAELQITPAGSILLNTTRDTGYALQEGRWSLANPSMAVKRPADEPDYMEGLRARPLPPSGGTSHPAVQDLRGQIMRLYEENRFPLSDTQLERATALTFQDVLRHGGNTVTRLAFSVDRDSGQSNPHSNIIAWQGDPRDPATVWTSIPLHQPDPPSLADVWQEIDNRMHPGLQADTGSRHPPETRTQPCPHMHPVA